MADVDTPTQVDSAVEREALAMGWIPREKFKGDGSKWTDAETFVKRGKELMPILRATNAKQAAELARLSTQVEGLQTALGEAAESMEAFRKYHEETAIREYEKARKELLARKKQALADLKDGDGDPTAIVELDEAITALDAAKPTKTESAKKVEPPANDPTKHPDFIAWSAENQAWLSDPTKAAYASSVGPFVKMQNPGVTGRALLDKLTEAVEEKFGSPSGGGKSLESGSRNPGGRAGGSGRAYADLPADAKAACDKQAARLVGPNKAFKTVDEWRKQYVADYDWS